MSTVSSTFDTDLAQRRSNARLAAPERKRDVDRGGERVRERERMRRSSARVYARIVEFGPLLAFTACLMNFEKLAHGSPQWTQGAQTHASSSLRPLRPFRPPPGTLSDIPTAYRRESRTETRSYNLPGLASRVILGSTLCHCRRRPGTLFVILCARLSTGNFYLASTALRLRRASAWVIRETSEFSWPASLSEKTFLLLNRFMDMFFYFFTENAHSFKRRSKSIVHRVKCLTELFDYRHKHKGTVTRQMVGKKHSSIF